MTLETATPPTWLVDAHVHLHPCFDRKRFLDGAQSNLSLGASALGARPDGGVLCFTESAGVHRHRELRESAGRTGTGGWRMEATEETAALVARRDGEPPLVLVAGRQIVTADGLEVLALGADLPVPDGRPLVDVLAEVREGGAAAVVPWGFGKWSGRRGALLRRLLESGALEGCFLGDNSGRLAFGARPALFSEAERRGVAVLPGSDPLPFPSQAGRAGRYGFLAQFTLDAARPATSLLGHLRTLRTSPCTFGRLEHLPGFMMSQVRMQLRKRRPAEAASAR
jgi:hypothetical protein